MYIVGLLLCLFGILPFFALRWCSLNIRRPTGFQPPPKHDPPPLTPTTFWTTSPHLCKDWLVVLGGVLRHWGSEIQSIPPKEIPNTPSPIPDHLLAVARITPLAIPPSGLLWRCDGGLTFWAHVRQPLKKGWRSVGIWKFTTFWNGTILHRKTHHHQSPFPKWWIFRCPDLRNPRRRS